MVDATGVYALSERLRGGLTDAWREVCVDGTTCASRLLVLPLFVFDQSSIRELESLVSEEIQTQKSYRTVLICASLCTSYSIRASCAKTDTLPIPHELSTFLLHQPSSCSNRASACQLPPQVRDVNPSIYFRTAIYKCTSGSATIL